MNIKNAIGVACLLLAAGCSNPFVEDAEKIERPTEGKALVNVYQRAGPRVVIELWEGEKLLSLASGPMLAQIQFEPGEHLLLAVTMGKTGALQMDLKAGKIYDLLIFPAMSVNMKPIAPDAKERKSRSGRRFIQSCRTVRTRPDEIKKYATKDRRTFARHRRLAYDKGGAWNWKVKKMGDEAAR